MKKRTADSTINDTVKKKRYNPDQRCSELIRHIQEHCERNSVSYYALAREADISTSTLHALMAGKTKPYMYTVYKICNALDISILDLVVEAEESAEKTGLTHRERMLIAQYRKYSESKKEMLEVYMDMLTQFKENKFSIEKHDTYSNRC